MKLDIFKKRWLDIVFEGRNKSYGAYELRRENPKTSIKSLVGGAVIFATAMATPLIIDMLPKREAQKDKLDDKVVLVNLEKPRVDPLLPPPPPPEPPKPKIDEVKFVKPKVVEAKKVVEEIKTIEELKDKNIAQKDQKGDDKAEIKIDQPSGNADVGAEVVDNNIYNSAGIEVQPEFPGGAAGFMRYVQRNYRTPEVEEDLKGRVFVEFVVEKDGSLTDIKVLRDLGFGTGAEAIRMLKNAPKWKPGVQNGKTIRVKYSLPIMLDIKME
jgi:periplasmic protein TonB